MGWTDVQNQGNGDKKEINYMEFVSGKPATFRVLDAEPYSRGVHWIQAANGGKGLSVDCIGNGCPACAEMKVRKAANTAGRDLTWRKMHAINVLDKADDKVKILDKGKRCFEPLANFIGMIGDLRDYDVMMTQTGTGNDTNYTPIPLPKVPLTDAQKKLDKYDFATVYPKVTPEQMAQFLAGAGWKEVLGVADDSAASGDDDHIDVDFNAGGK